MTHISIIGTGNMGQAIAGIAAKGGNTVEVFNQPTRQWSPATSSFSPFPTRPSPTHRQTRDQLVGKVVVDITNPLNFERSTR